MVIRQPASCRHVPDSLFSIRPSCCSPPQLPHSSLCPSSSIRRPDIQPIFSISRTSDRIFARHRPEMSTISLPARDYSVCAARRGSMASFRRASSLLRSAVDARRRRCSPVSAAEVHRRAAVTGASCRISRDHIYNNDQTDDQRHHRDIDRQSLQSTT